MFNQINKFLFMFIIGFSLLFSVSNAYLLTETPVSGSATFSSETFSGTIGGYTISQIADFYNSSQLDVRDAMLEAVSNAGYYVVWAPNTNNLSTYVHTYIIPKDSDTDIGMRDDATTFRPTFYFSEGVHYYYRYSSGSGTCRVCTVAGSKSDVNSGVPLDTFFSKISEDSNFFGTFPYLKKVYTANGKYWTGEYFYKTETEPDGPDYSADLSGLISSITSSSVVQDNTNATDREYFIIPYGSIAGKPLYEVYFYNSRINLSAFEYLGNDENLYYDLDKISIDGVIAKLVDYFGVRGNYSYTNGEYFSVLYDSTLETADISYNGQFSFDDYLMKGLSSKNNPIIYTTKDITFYHYVKDETTGEWVATADESKNIVNELITDSGGNEISPVVPGSETPLSQTPWERVISVIKTVPESILAGLKKLFIPDLTYLQGTLDKLNTKLCFITQAREIVEDVTNSIELNPIAPPSISIDLTNANSKYNWGTGAICLDLSWYEPYKPAVDFLIICFCYGFFFWNLFRKLPDIINGISGDVPLMSYQSQRISNNSKRDSIGFKTK